MKSTTILVCGAILFAIIIANWGNNQEGASSNLISEEYEQITDRYNHTLELHWSDMPITYSYDKECEFKIINANGTYPKVRDDETIGQIERGLSFISNRTRGAVVFKKTEENPDITYVCDSSSRVDYGYDTWQTDGEAQTYTWEGTNIFAPGTVSLIRLGNEECEETRPIIVIHETLHMLGLKHNMFVGDIMNPYNMKDCKADISKIDLDYLWEIYDPTNRYKPYKSKYNCNQKYYSCSDFNKRLDAQEVLDFCGAVEDIHSLDPDKDSIACENLK